MSASIKIDKYIIIGDFVEKKHFISTLLGCIGIIIAMLYWILFINENNKIYNVFRYLIIFAALLVIVLAVFKYFKENK